MDVTDVVVEHVAAPMPWNTSASYGLGRVLDDTSPATMVVTPLPFASRAGSTISVPAGRLIPVASSLAPEAAILAPAVAQVLWMWDALQLELGELAVVTHGHPLSQLAVTVAQWYGAEPVLLGAGGNAAVYSFTGAEHPSASLADELRHAPGVVAAELSGGVELLDILLEALPPFARPMLAGMRGETVTMDFYVNVHRKGLTMLSGILDPAASFGSPGDLARVERALRLLASPPRAAQCRAAMAG